MDRAFTLAEQERAEHAEALLCVINGWSRNSQAQPCTYNFYSSLRCDFVPLTPYLLKKSIIALEVHVAQQVHAHIGKHPFVSVAVDGWEDHQKLPTLAFTVHLPDGSCYLYKFERIHNPESRDFLEAKIDSMLEDIESKLKVEVVDVVADNAKDIQKGIRQANETGSFFQPNCFAHTLQLLLQDLSSLFNGQFEQLKQVEVFFREPHTAYVAMCEQFTGTMLIQYGETRWGSNIECLQSLRDNRQVIEIALLKLRADGFAFKGSELMFVWAPSSWVTLNHLKHWLIALKCLILQVEADSITLGNVVHITILVLNALLPKLKSFAPSDVRLAKPMVEQRCGMLLRTPALLAYLMVYR